VALKAHSKDTIKIVALKAHNYKKEVMNGKNNPNMYNRNSKDSVENFIEAKRQSKRF
jgi:hypothetical protein